jgi:hypothetical protein
VRQETRENEVGEERLAALLGDAFELFVAILWDPKRGGSARDSLDELGLKEKTLRDFGVGYAPVGPDVLFRHLRGLGYTDDEIVESGLATRSVRGRAHAHFRSRLMFPVRDRDGLLRGFAALGTHLGPSWALWVTSPDTGLYRRSEAVFGIDRAAPRIQKTSRASVKADCVEVLRAHQSGERDAVAVQTNSVTAEQLAALAVGVKGGAAALELDLPPGMSIDSEAPTEAKAAVRAAPKRATEPTEPPPRHLNLKRTAIVTATALAAVNGWTGAPLLAVWVGSQVQPGRLLTMWGVVTVIAVLGVLSFLLVWALTWLGARYDELTGRSALASQTSPWHRTMRGDRVEDIRTRYGVSAPEKAVAISFVAAVLVFEVWFFFFAGSSL